MIFICSGADARGCFMTSNQFDLLMQQIIPRRQGLGYHRLVVVVVVVCALSLAAVPTFLTCFMSQLGRKDARISTIVVVVLGIGLHDANASIVPSAYRGHGWALFVHFA